MLGKSFQDQTKLPVEAIKPELNLQFRTDPPFSPKYSSSIPAEEQENVINTIPNHVPTNYKSHSRSSSYSDSANKRLSLSPRKPIPLNGSSENLNLSHSISSFIKSESLQTEYEQRTERSISIDPFSSDFSVTSTQNSSPIRYLQSSSQPSSTQNIQQPNIQTPNQYGEFKQVQKSSILHLSPSIVLNSKPFIPSYVVSSISDSNGILGVDHYTGNPVYCKHARGLAFMTRPRTVFEEVIGSVIPVLHSIAVSILEEIRLINKENDPTSQEYNTAPDYANMRIFGAIPRTERGRIHFMIHVYSPELPILDFFERTVMNPMILGLPFILRIYPVTQASNNLEQLPVMASNLLDQYIHFHYGLPENASLQELTRTLQNGVKIGGGTSTQVHSPLDSVVPMFPKNLKFQFDHSKLKVGLALESHQASQFAQTLISKLSELQRTMDFVERNPSNCDIMLIACCFNDTFLMSLWHPINTNNLNNFRPGEMSFWLNCNPEKAAYICSFLAVPTPVIWDGSGFPPQQQNFAQRMATHRPHGTQNEAKQRAAKPQHGSTPQYFVKGQKNKTPNGGSHIYKGKSHENADNEDHQSTSSEQATTSSQPLRASFAYPPYNGSKVPSSAYYPYSYDYIPMIDQFENSGHYLHPRAVPIDMPLNFPNTQQSTQGVNSRIAGTLPPLSAPIQNVIPLGFPKPPPNFGQNMPILKPNRISVPAGTNIPMFMPPYSFYDAKSYYDSIYTYRS